MDLILWRHAEAQDGRADLERQLSERGRRQAARVAEWLLQRLPQGFSVVASPAARAQQTAAALGVRFRTEGTIAPGASVDKLLAAARWPGAQGLVILVGHQPDLGLAAAYLVAGTRAGWHLDKGALWWLAAEADQVVVRAVASPDLL